MTAKKIYSTPAFNQIKMVIWDNLCKSGDFDIAAPKYGDGDPSLE